MSAYSNSTYSSDEPDDVSAAVKRYRKKPIVIESVQCDAGNLELVAKWCGGEVRYASRGEDEPYWGVDIDTLEGTMTARVWDWVIRGVQGEFYPCKPDIFAQTYEAVTE
jgi:hypothetical protein